MRGVEAFIFVMALLLVGQRLQVAPNEMLIVAIVLAVGCQAITVFYKAEDLSDKIIKRIFVASTFFSIVLLAFLSGYVFGQGESLLENNLIIAMGILCVGAWIGVAIRIAMVKPNHLR